MPRPITFAIISVASAALSAGLFWYGQSRTPPREYAQAVPPYVQTASDKGSVAAANPLDQFRQRLSGAKTQQERDAATIEMVGAMLSMFQATAESDAEQSKRISTLEGEVKKLSEKPPAASLDGSSAANAVPVKATMGPDYVDLVCKVGGLFLALISMVFGGIAAWGAVRTVQMARNASAVPEQENL